MARTGRRAGEVCKLAADGVVLIGDSHWLRVPLGQPERTRTPTPPSLVAPLLRWVADQLDHTRTHRRLIADRRRSIDRHALARVFKRIGRRAGIFVRAHFDSIGRSIT